MSARCVPEGLPFSDEKSGRRALICPQSCPCIFWPEETAVAELVSYTSDVEHTPEHLVAPLAASLLAAAQRVGLNQLK